MRLNFNYLYPVKFHGFMMLLTNLSFKKSNKSKLVEVKMVGAASQFDPSKFFLKFVLTLHDIGWGNTGRYCVDFLAV